MIGQVEGILDNAVQHLAFGDQAMPLGDQLTLDTREKILKGKYIDTFSSLSEA